MISITTSNYSTLSQSGISFDYIADVNNSDTY